MIPLTEDRKMLGYELLASYPGISCFVTPVMEGAARETMPPSIVRLTRETKLELCAAIRK